ncbi:hypothetical protein BDP27DRAFT_1390000 [Rhodocollybia butyracea]|uniref:PQ-loop-domain-containing protein n=1 Tax=Rhodocollybia butyracea TaxID=206335 RepID=A0A9P5Q6N5_9AGAR|nr:hypothetical protein BDP27DRAFT_1390000 [Rhodocollybia butyracea]
MPVNSVAENVFGIAGTVCWTIQLVPQLWKSWREKDTTGLSEWMILAWSVSGAFLGTYSIVVVLNIPLIVQPQLFSALTMASWAQCQYYSRHRTLSVAWMLFLLGCVILGSFELGMVYALRSSYSRGEKSGIAGAEFFSIMSSVILALSFIPQYYEIYKRREVIGISLAFMAVDILGIFSDLSLVFKAGPFDAVAAVTYSLVVAMDGVVVIAAWILNPRARRRPIVTTSTPSETIAPSSRTTIEKEVRNLVHLSSTACTRWTSAARRQANS